METAATSSSGTFPLPNHTYLNSDKRTWISMFFKSRVGHVNIAEQRTGVIAASEKVDLVVLLYTDSKIRL